MRAIGKGISDSAGGSIEKDPCLPVGSIRPPGGGRNIRRWTQVGASVCVCVRKRQNMDFFLKEMIRPARRRRERRTWTFCLNYKTMNYN